jgi:hypothetical protein
MSDNGSPMHSGSGFGSIFAIVPILAIPVLAILFWPITLAAGILWVVCAMFIASKRAEEK